MTDGMTEKARRSRLLDSGLSTKAYKLGNPFIVRLKYDDVLQQCSGSPLTPRFQEKFLKILYMYPYREPTQVGKESILR